MLIPILTPWQIGFGRYQKRSLLILALVDFNDGTGITNSTFTQAKESIFSRVSPP